MKTFSIIRKPLLALMLMAMAIVALSAPFLGVFGDIRGMRKKLFRFFMLKFAINYSGITNKTTFRFGVLIALTSALIVSAISLANILLISQGSMQEIVDTAMQSYTSVTPLGDSERIAIERMMSWLPHISFFTTFIYCFLYGTVVAKIFSTAIPPRDIFKDDNSTDEQ